MTKSKPTTPLRDHRWDKQLKEEAESSSIFACDHIVGDSNYGHSLVVESGTYSVYETFNFCPKCGEKLND